MKTTISTRFIFCSRHSVILAAGVLAALSASPVNFAFADEAAPQAAVKSDPKLDRELLEALQDNDTFTIDEALQKGANVNARDKGGNTALMLAVQSGSASLVKKMLAAGGDAKATNKNNQSTLHLATTIGAPKPKKKKFGGFGSLLGGAAISAGVGGGLGNFGSSGAWAANLLGAGGFDSLLGANLEGLLQGGVFNLTSKSGWSAIVGTALQGDLKANGLYGMQSALSGSVPGLGFSAGRLDANGWMNLAGAVQSSNPQVLSVMSTLPNGNAQWSQFMNAAANGNRAQVETMLADPTMQPLFEQAGAGMKAASADLPGNAAKTIVTDLLAAGADVSLKDKDGKTAAELAEKRDLKELVQLLNAKPVAPVAAEIKTETTVATATTTETSATQTPKLETENKATQ